jgi:hypothetical protein
MENGRKYPCIDLKKGVIPMKKDPNESSKIAGRTYDASDYQKNDELSSGLAETHEQFSDTYMEGTVDQNLGAEE